MDMMPPLPGARNRDNGLDSKSANQTARHSDSQGRAIQKKIGDNPGYMNAGQSGLGSPASQYIGNRKTEAVNTGLEGHQSFECSIAPPMDSESFTLSSCYWEQIATPHPSVVEGKIFARQMMDQYSKVLDSINQISGKSFISAQVYRDSSSGEDDICLCVRDNETNPPMEYIWSASDQKIHVASTLSEQSEPLFEYCQLPHSEGGLSWLEPMSLANVSSKAPVSESDQSRVNISGKEYSYSDNLPVSRGAAGSVYYALDENHEPVCLKQALNSSEWDGLKSEYEILSDLKNACVVSAKAHSPEHHMMVLEWCDGTIDDEFLEPLSLNQRAKLVQELTSAVAYCHEQKIAHNDIKIQNLLHKDGVCKLGDFGSAVDFSGREEVVLPITSDFQQLIDSGYLSKEDAVAGLTRRMPDSFEEDKRSTLLTSYNILCGKDCWYDDPRQGELERVLPKNIPEEGRNELLGMYRVLQDDLSSEVSMHKLASLVAVLT